MYTMEAQGNTMYVFRLTNRKPEKKEKNEIKEIRKLTKDKQKLIQGQRIEDQNTKINFNTIIPFASHKSWENAIKKIFLMFIYF